MSQPLRLPPRRLRTLLAGVLILAAAYLGLIQLPRPGGPAAPRLDPGQAPGPAPDSVRVPADRPAATDEVLRRAFAERRSNLQVEGNGVVSRLLPDDHEGSRHQRFIVRLASGQTLLIAHNIDLAPRLEALQAGDTVSFAGEYEWSAEGGVVHWTHHDPQGRHPGGHLRHQGQTYR